MRYPARPEPPASVEAFQTSEIVVVVLDGLFKPVGVDGGVVSGGGVTTLLTLTVMEEAVAVLAELSVATAVRVCGPLAKVMVSQM